MRQLQGHHLRASRLRQAQLAGGTELHVETLLLAGEVADIQRQLGFIATGKETRRRQLGDQRCGHHRFTFGHAVAVVAPGLRHQAQLAVEVRDSQADFALALRVQAYWRALLGNNQHAGVRAFAARLQARITTEGQLGHPALAGFDQLAINIQLVSTVTLATEERGKRVRGGVLGDIEDADIDRRQQHLRLFGHRAIGVHGLDLDRQRLIRTHFLRRTEAQRQLARCPLQRQVQQADCTLGRDIGLALTRTDNQGADIQVMPCPLFGDRNLNAFAFRRHVDGLPPQRPLGGFHQQITTARGRRSDGDRGGVAIAIGRFVQRQLDLIGTHGAAFGVVLPAVAGPETQAAEQAGLRVFDLDAVRAPLDREADLGGAAFGHGDRLFAEVQVLLVVVIAPAIALGEVPVVVAALANQTHLQPVAGQLVALRIGQQQLELGQAIAVDFFAVKQRTQARQLLSRPHRLDDAPGDRPATGLLQAGLQDQFQWRLDLGPFAFDLQAGLAVGIQHGLVQLQVLVQFLFIDRAELIARQARHRFAQRAHINLPTKAIAGRRRAVQVAAGDLELSILGWAEWHLTALQLQRQALGQEVFDEKFIQLRLTITQVEHQLPAPGRRFAGNR